jgi:di/tricarboxylate transporter
MDLNGWITLAVLLSILYGLMRSIAPPDLLFMGGLVVLILCGIVRPGEAFAGFSNHGLITVACLFVVAAGLQETGLLNVLGKGLLSGASTSQGVILRMSGVVLPMSAFLNNTPIVAMFVPIVLEWCRRRRISPSKLLIPLSFLAILGGTCTLIGTSTNLIVNGLMIDHNLRPMSLFEIAWIGIPYAIVGTGYLMLFGDRLLPERKELLEQLGETLREYLFEMEVSPGCHYVGKTVEEVGLRGLPGLFLIEISREREVLSPVRPEDVIETNDRMTFAGVVSGILDLEKVPGLIPAVDPTFEVSPRQQRERRLCEAVISVNSRLIGKTIREADIRAAYGAAVLAVHRGGARVAKKVGDIRLRPGDTLLMQVPREFLRVYRNDPAFYLVSGVPEWRPIRSDRSRIAFLIFITLIVLMTSGIVDLVVAAVLAAVAMLAFGCISAGEGRRSIDWQVLITIAAALGVGKAVENSGVAEIIAGGLVDLVRPWGPLAALSIIFLLASAITCLVTNNAAAVLMFPFCISTAEKFDVSPYPFMVALMLAASASFITPIGYQTNMMVYGPGGYRFNDFVRIGFPLTILLWLVAAICIPLVWQF